jgi:hypothetical protein
MARDEAIDVIANGAGARSGELTEGAPSATELA